jgi:uncharacterized protein
MRGTWSKQPHCIALHRPAGHDRRCGELRDLRREAPRLPRSADVVEDGTPNPQCDNARIAYGLAPLTRDEIERALGA